MKRWWIRGVFSNCGIVCATHGVAGARGTHLEFRGAGVTSVTCDRSLRVWGKNKKAALVRRGRKRYISGLAAALVKIYRS